MESLLLDIGWTLYPSELSFVQICRSCTYLQHQAELRQHFQPSRLVTMQCTHSSSYRIAMVSLPECTWRFRALLRIQTAATDHWITSFQAPFSFIANCTPILGIPYLNTIFTSNKTSFTSNWTPLKKLDDSEFKGNVLQIKASFIHIDCPKRLDNFFSSRSI